MASIVFLLLAPASAAASAPAVVDGVALDGAVVDRDVEAVRAQDPELTRRDARAVVLGQALRDEWSRREAEALGIVVADDEVARYEARERALAGGRWSTPFDERLAVEGWDVARYREAARARLRERKLFDRFLATTRGDAAYLARFARYRADWRRRTACDPAYATADLCGTSAPPRRPCLDVGPVTLCRLPGVWSVFDDAADALGVYNNSVAQDRLAAAIRRTRPALARRVELDSEADFLGVSARRRLDVVAVVRIAHRLSLRVPTPPLLGPYG